MFVVYIAGMIKLEFIIRIMLYHTLPVEITFDSIPRFLTSMTLLSRSIETFAYVNNKYIFLKGIVSYEGKVGEQ